MGFKTEIYRQIKALQPSELVPDKIRMSCETPPVFSRVKSANLIHPSPGRKCGFPTCWFTRKLLSKLANVAKWGDIFFAWDFGPDRNSARSNLKNRPPVEDYSESVQYVHLKSTDFAECSRWIYLSLRRGGRLFCNRSWCPKERWWMIKVWLQISRLQQSESP